jgi:hypothetical protein
MKSFFFLFGLIILFFSSLAWASSSGNSLFEMTGGEFLTLLTISVVMMIPEVVGQLKKFFGSGDDDVPF